MLQAAGVDLRVVSLGQEHTCYLIDGVMLYTISTNFLQIVKPSFYEMSSL